MNPNYPYGEFILNVNLETCSRQQQQQQQKFNNNINVCIQKYFIEKTIKTKSNQKYLYGWILCMKTFCVSQKKKTKKKTNS